MTREKQKLAKLVEEKLAKLEESIKRWQLRYKSFNSLLDDKSAALKKYKQQAKQSKLSKKEKANLLKERAEVLKEHAELEKERVEVLEDLVKLQSLRAKLTELEDEVSQAKLDEFEKRLSKRILYFQFILIFSVLFAVIFSGLFIGRVFDIPFDVVWHYTETVSIGVGASIIAHLLLRFFPWGGFSKREGTRLFGEVERLSEVMAEMDKGQAKILKKLKKG